MNGGGDVKPIFSCTFQDKLFSTSMRGIALGGETEVQCCGEDLGPQSSQHISGVNLGHLKEK